MYPRVRTREDYRKDNLRHLCEEDFQARLPYAQQYIQQCFVPCRTWQSCYNLKQAMTSRIGYCFTKDMARYMSLCGFEVKMNRENLWLVRGKYRDDIKFPEENPIAIALPWREVPDPQATKGSLHVQ